MSWVSDIADKLGSIFTGGGDTVVPSSSSNQLGDGFYGSLIGAGTQILGSYLNAKDQRKLAEEYAKQKKAEFDAQQALAEKALAMRGGGGGGGGGDSGLKRKALLADLYNNYASNVAAMGRSYGEVGNQIGGNVGGVIGARANKL